jgi:hypothetical protein
MKVISMDIDAKSLDMTVLEKIMEGKYNEIVSTDDDASMSFESTNNLFHFGQNNLTHKYCLDNNNYNYDDEIVYPFSKIIKLKHEPEAAQENKSVHYTADIIVEIKNRDGRVVHMRALLDIGTTATIILREFVRNGSARTDKNKRTKWKTLGGTFATNYESLLVINYSHSRNPPCAPARTHGRIQAPREPPN